MDPDDISVVLARAAELHVKISDAIERSMQSGSSLTSKGDRDERPAFDIENTASGSSSVFQGHVGKQFCGKESTHEKSSEPLGDGTAEARSLASIRDALEVLEDQLECLQTLQQQQRAEKDATLAELEESRRILLRRLKDHRGKEWEVVHEALAFAGEPVDERDDLPLPPYPMPFIDVSSFASLDGQIPTFNGGSFFSENGVVKRLMLEDEEEESCQDMVEEDSEGDEGNADEDDQHIMPSVSRGILGSLKSNVSNFLKGTLGQVVIVAGKVALVAVGAVAVVVLSDATQRWQRERGASRSSRYFPSGTAPKASNAHQIPQDEKCPPGKFMILEHGLQRCVVKERVELPFQHDVKNPDVSYGRG